MTKPIPTITSDGAEALDGFLKKTVTGGRVPAVVFGATSAQETIYWNQAGDVVFGDPSKGQIDEDTSKSFLNPCEITLNSQPWSCFRNPSS